MPGAGELVTVRALWPMPGVPDRAVTTVSWGPQLAALVDAGRYEVLPGRAAPPPPGDGEVPGPADTADTAGDGAGGRPARRPRGR